MDHNTSELKEGDVTKKHNFDIMELYKIYRSYEEHENELLNQRTTWFVTIQSVLVATFGFSFQKYYEIAEKLSEAKNGITPLKIDISIDDLTKQYVYFLLILCFVGGVAGLFAFFSIWAARSAQVSLRKSWKKIIIEREAFEKFGLPNLSGGGNRRARLRGATFSLLLPIVFTAGWIGILVAVLATKIKFM